MESNQRYNELIKNHHDKLKSNFSVLEEVCKHKDRKTWNDDLEYLEGTIKFSCFLSSSFLDLLSVLKGINNSETEWEFVFYSKKGYLSIYETISTFNFYQKKLRIILSSLDNELLKELDLINSRLKQYKKRNNYENLISKVRNKAAGHYDNEFTVFYEHIKKLNKHDSISAVEEFLNFLKSLMTFIYKVVHKMEDKYYNTDSADKYY